MVESYRQIKYRAEYRIGEYVRFRFQPFRLAHGDYLIIYGDRHEDQPGGVPYIAPESHPEIEYYGDDGIWERIPVKFRFAAHFIMFISS